MKSSYVNENGSFLPKILEDESVDLVDSGFHEDVATLEIDDWIVKT